MEPEQSQFPQVRALAQQVRSAQLSENSGHDWWHTWRVYRLATWLAQQEGASIYVVELLALCHDLEDHKLYQGERIRPWLAQAGVATDTAERVYGLVQQLGFPGAGQADPQLPLEALVVRDADRLDALGAIGIARTFAFGGARGRELYDPGESPTLHQSQTEYRRSGKSSLIHFYEKLLHLRQRIYTPAAQPLAQQRHDYLEGFLQQFLAEWEGHDGLR